MCTMHPRWGLVPYIAPSPPIGLGTQQRLNVVTILALHACRGRTLAVQNIWFSRQTDTRQTACGGVHVITSRT